MDSKDKQSKLIDFLTRERQNLLLFLRSKFYDLSEMDLEDMVSDLVLHFFDKANFTAPIENFTAYIYRAVYYKGLDLIKRRRRTVSLDQVNGTDNRTLGNLLPDPNQEMLPLISHLELREHLFEVLSQLDPKSREVWIATELEGYSFKELAAAWGEPIGTLLARKSRTAKKIAEAFKDFKNTD
jgi:RNA polymerase sigma factor (sigma-70 family)